MRQFNKQYGLKKLQQIAKGARNASVSPQVVLDSPEQFRIAQAKGMPRLLIRTDEIGRTYKRLNYGDMPREDILLDSHTKADESKVRIGLQDIISRKRSKRLKIIVHPTRKREDIALAGMIRISPKLTVLGIARPRLDKDHREVIRTDFQLQLRKDKRGFRLTGASGLRTLSPEEQKFIAHALAFLNKGLREGQIKAQHSTELNFLSWKDKPSEPEFYGLVEKRGKFGPFDY